jgi:hypothetical protein
LCGRAGRGDDGYGDGHNATCGDHHSGRHGRPKCGLLPFHTVIPPYIYKWSPYDRVSALIRTVAGIATIGEPRTASLLVLFAREEQNAV